MGETVIHHTSPHTGAMKTQMIFRVSPVSRSYSPLKIAKLKTSYFGCLLCLHVIRKRQSCLYSSKISEIMRVQETRTKHDPLISLPSRKTLLN